MVHEEWKGVSISSGSGPAWLSDWKMVWHENKANWKAEKELDEVRDASLSFIHMLVMELVSEVRAFEAVVLAGTWPGQETPHGPVIFRLPRVPLKLSWRKEGASSGRPCATIPSLSFMPSALAPKSVSVVSVSYP